MFRQFSVRGRSIFESGCMFVKLFFKILYLPFRFELFCDVYKVLLHELKVWFFFDSKDTVKKPYWKSAP